MEIEFNKNGIIVNGTQLETVFRISDLEEITGPHDRITAKGKCYVWDKLGIYCLVSEEDPHLNTEFHIHIKGETTFEVDPHEGYSGILRIGDEKIDFASDNKDKRIKEVFNHKENDVFTEVKLGENLAVISTGDEDLIDTVLIYKKAEKKPKEKNFNCENPVPSKVYDIQIVDIDAKDGWMSSLPPGIKNEQWPRSYENGSPMMHIFTVKVPAEYRVKGENLVAISVFQADSEIGVDEDVQEFFRNKGNTQDVIEDQLRDNLSAYINTRHKKEIIMKDLIDNEWALIWLTEDEFNGKKAEIPNEEEFDSCENYKEVKFLKLVERKDDPNAGKSPSDDDDDPDYIPIYSQRVKDLGLEKFFGKQHFGGTSSPCQMEPDNFSPFYLEFDETLGGANLGGDGAAQIDLLNDKIDWSCG